MNFLSNTTKFERNKPKVMGSMSILTRSKENILRNSQEFNLNELKILRQTSCGKRMSCYENSKKTMMDTKRFSTRDSVKEGLNLRMEENKCFHHSMFKRFSDVKSKQIKKNGSLSAMPTMVIKICQNHQDRQGKYFTLVSDQNNPHQFPQEEKAYYCQQCAINLSQMDFLIRKIPHYHQNIPAIMLLNDLFKCKEDLSNRIDQTKDLIVMKTYEKQIQEIESKFANIMSALQKVKKEEILKLQIRKMEAYQKATQSQNFLQGLKKKITYLISDLGKKIKTKTDDAQKNTFKHEICYELYSEVIEKTKKSLQKISKNSAQRPSLLKGIKIMDEIQICDKTKNYFQERVHELSFQDSEPEQKNDKNPVQMDQESLQLQKNINVLQISKFEATFGNNSSITPTDLEYSKMTPREDLQEKLVFEC